MKLIKKLKRTYKNFNLSRKMLSVYVLIFGAFIVISIAAMQVTLAIYEEKLYQKSLQELDYFTKTIDMELNNIEKVSYSIAMDYDIQKQLAYMMKLDNYQEYSFNMSSFRSRLLVEALTAESLTEITYTDRKNIEFNVGKKYLKIPDETYNKLLEKAQKAEGAYVYMEPTLDFPYLISGRDIREHIDFSLDYLGTIMFNCNISDMIDKNRSVLENGKSELYIFSDDQIIYGNNEMLFNKLPKLDKDEGYEIINFNKEKYFMSFLRSEKTNWRYVNLVPYSSIYYLNTMVRYIMVFFFFIVFVISFFIMIKISKKITLPLEELTQSMRIVEKGEFEQAIAYLGNEEDMDEIGILKKDFQIMLDKIKLLIYENYEKQLMLKDTQYKALQAQINPHFLYNTLNAINWMIKSKMNDEASKMIVALGDLLRAAFIKEPLISVQQEVELLNSYIAIQKIRYDKRAEFIITLDGELQHYAIPRMILQPLVENAISYAVDQSLELCKIKISLFEQRDRLVIEVEDDGPGMEPELLEKVRHFEMKPIGNGIGLKNIKERLNLIFEQQFEFDIDSTLGEGTKVRIVVPRYNTQSV